MIRPPVLAVFAAVFCATCRSATAQTPTFEGLAYANLGGTDLRLDLYLPSAAIAPYPVAVHIHGGGWGHGARAPVPPLAALLLERGFAVASIDYRLTSEAGGYGPFRVIYPAQIEDAKGAVRWLRANAATYQLDGARIAAFGQSAGGHLAILLATTRNVSALEGGIGGNLAFSSGVQAAVAYYPPTEFRTVNDDITFPPGSTLDHDAPNSPESRLLGWDEPGQGLGDIKANWTSALPPYPALVTLTLQASPLFWVDSLDAPIFLAHGTHDTVVSVNQSLRLSSALYAAGVRHEVHALPGAEHVFASNAMDQSAARFLAELLIGPTRPVAGQAFCYGDNSGADCPCDNSSWVGARTGCEHAFGVGASLTAIGFPSVSQDTLLLRGDSMPNSTALYIQGTSRAAGGAGVVFGDGLRCVSGTIIRLATQTNLAGSSVYPEPGELPVSLRGLVSVGSTRHYQVHFRDAQTYCSAATWNLSNGLTATWLP
jgi:acetyl esterase/lipase